MTEWEKREEEHVHALQEAERKFKWIVDQAQEALKTADQNSVAMRLIRVVAYGWLKKWTNVG